MKHEDESPTIEWHTLGFLPAPTGWRLVFLGADGLVYTSSLPGWLVEEQVAYTDGWDARGGRRVIAAGEERGCLYPATDLEDGGAFWYVIGPDDPGPAREVVRAEHERRTRLHQRATTTPAAGGGDPV